MLLSEMSNHASLLGFVSNGEFSVFRNKGYKQPISVFNIRSRIRKKYSRMSIKVMKDMLCKWEEFLLLQWSYIFILSLFPALVDGNITAKCSNQAVSPDYLKKLYHGS